MKQNRGYKKGDQMKFPIVFLFFSFIYLQASQPPKRTHKSFRRNSLSRLQREQAAQKRRDIVDMGTVLSKSSPVKTRTNSHLAKLRPKSLSTGN